jgi:hypothetical protein
MRTIQFTRLSVSVAFVIVSFTPAAGEEELLKGDGKYLGWQKVKETFVTCDEVSIDIGTGKVQQTNLKCPGHKRGTFASFGGTVKAVNRENRTISLEDASGRSREFFVPAKDEGTAWQLQKGDKVSGSEGPVTGRAESIQKKWH